jgi:transmembrane sensor
MATHADIEATAADWLAKRDRPDWNGSDEVALADWLDRDPARRVAFIRLESAWRRGARLKAVAAGWPAGVLPKPEEWPPSPYFARTPSMAEATSTPPPRTIRPTRWRAAVAVAVTLAAVAVTWFFWPTGTAYRTAIGGLEAVPMADGSKVTLNTDTGIRVALSAAAREVELQRGEAYFEVAKDTARPFVVRAGNERVIAVGTKFSVRRDADGIRVVVTEGRVRVESAVASTPDPGALVSAGSIAHARNTGVFVQEATLPVAQESLSWRQGYVVFRDTPFSTAAAEFNRYNLRKIVIVDPTLASIRIGGHFRATNAEGFVQLLAEELPLQLDVRDDQIFVTHR